MIHIYSWYKLVSVITCSSCFVQKDKGCGDRFNPGGRCGTHLDPLQINGVHDSPLKELHGGEVPLEQSLQLEIWWFPKCHRPDKMIWFSL